MAFGTRLCRYAAASHVSPQPVTRPPSPSAEHQDEAAPSKTGGVIAVDRALLILDAFIGASEPLSLSEIARATSLVKPTVLRSLASLEKAGYVLRVADRRYALGAKAMEIGAAYTRNFRLDAVVMPALRRLTAETGESASFLVREAGKRVCLFRIDSPQRVREVAELNVAIFLDGTSGSRALLHDSVPVIGDQRPVYFTSGVNDPQSASISTPIYGMGHLIGALSLSAPVHRLSRDHAEQFARSLAFGADALSAQLGGRSFAQAGFALVEPSAERPPRPVRSAAR